MLNLFQKKEKQVFDENLLQKLDRKYSRKIIDVVIRQIGKIDSAPEMAYFQLTRGSLTAFRSKSLQEAILYFSKIKNYLPGDTVYFKDLTEMWTPAANHSTGRIDFDKVKHDLENKSATVIFLKVLFEIHEKTFDYVSEGFNKVGFKFPTA